MTPYWPSPLGATHRRLAPKTDEQTFFFSSDSFQVQAPSAHRFPRPNRGLRWVVDADLPGPEDFHLGADTPMPDIG